MNTEYENGVWDCITANLAGMRAFSERGSSDDGHALVDMASAWGMSFDLMFALLPQDENVTWVRSELISHFQELIDAVNGTDGKDAA